MQHPDNVVFVSIALAFAASVFGCHGGDGVDPSVPPTETVANAPIDPPRQPLPAADPNHATSTPGALGTAPVATATSTGTAPTAPTPPPPADDPGPKPTGTCSITKDAAGFFTRTTSSVSYVGYVPASYDGQTPTRLVIGLHGCGDNAYNFATWGVNPYDTRTTQTHIGIALDGATAARGCWSMGGDDAKVLAAIDDIAACFWIHQKKVTIAGFSSGGELAYRVGMMNASRFDGILIESSAAYASSSDENALFAGASWKLPVAHRQHASDTTFPLASVQGDWAKITANGFPLDSSVTAGDHNGTSTDWASFLLPHIAAWSAP